MAAPKTRVVLEEVAEETPLAELAEALAVAFVEEK